MGELNPSPDCVTTRSTDLRLRYRPTSSPGFWVLCLPCWSSSLENPWSHNLYASSATCGLTWLSFAFISQWKKNGHHLFCSLALCKLAPCRDIPTLADAQTQEHKSSSHPGTHSVSSKQSTTKTTELHGEIFGSFPTE